MSQQAGDQENKPSNKSFELRVIFSVLETCQIVGTTAEEKIEFIEFVTDKKIAREKLFEYSQYVAKKLKSKIRNYKEISKILDNTILDRARYLKMCDAYWHRQSFERGCVPVVDIS